MSFDRPEDWLRALGATMPTPQNAQKYYGQAVAPDIGQTAQGFIPEWMPDWYRRSITAGAQRLGPGEQMALRGLSAIGGTMQAGSQEVLQPFWGGGMMVRDQVARGIRSLTDKAVSPFPDSQARDLLQSALEAPTSPITAFANPEAALPEQTRAGLAKYGEEQAARLPLGELGWAVATDPTTYIPFGGQAARIGRLGGELAARPNVLAQVGGRALQGAAKTAELYNVAVDAPVEYMVRQAARGIRNAPVIGAAFDPSKGALVAREQGVVGRGLNEILNFGQARLTDAGLYEPVRRTMDQFTNPEELKLPEGVAMWGSLRRMVQSIGDRIQAMENPHQQFVGVRAMDDVVDRKNWFEAEAAARRKELREQLGEQMITPKEFEQATDATFQWQGRNVAALYQGMHETLDVLDASEFPEVHRGVAAELNERVREGIQRMHDEALSKRDMDIVLKRGPDGEGVIFRQAHPEEVETLEAARDTLYRDTRAAQRSLLGPLADEIERQLGAPDELTTKLIDDAMQFYTGRVGELGEFAKPALERLGVVSGRTRTTMEAHLPGVLNATRRWRLVRERVIANAAPLLEKYYRAVPTEMVTDLAELTTGDAGRVSVPTAREAAAAVLTSSARLEKVLARIEAGSHLPGEWETIAALKRDLQKYKPAAADLLKPDDGMKLTMYEWGQKYAASQGVKSPPPWLSWYHTMMGIWRDTALLSPRFHGANLIWALFSGQMDDVQSGLVMRSLTEGFKDIHRQNAGQGPTGLMGWMRAAAEERLFVPRYAVELVPGLKELGRGDRNGFWTGPFELSMQTDSLATTGAGSADEALRRSGGGAVSRIPHAAWAGGVGAVSGGVAYQQTEGTQEEKLAAAARAAAIGAAGGAALRPFVWASKTLMRVIETAVRTEATAQWMMRAIPDQREKLLAIIDGQAEEALETIGKPLTAGTDLFGARPVRTMRDLMRVFPEPERYRPAPPDPAELERARNAWLQTDEGIEAAIDQPPEPPPAAPPATPPDVPPAPPAAPAAGLAPAGDVRLMRPEDISVDAGRFQFKSDVDVKTGAGKALSGVKRWEPESAGVLLVWRDPADGLTYVVNGHHRLAKMIELGVPEALVRYIDAPTAEIARARGALANLRDERASPTDAAKVMKQYQWGEAELREQGVPLKQAMVQKALALRDLDDGLFQRMTIGQLDEDIAASLARATPVAAEQRALLAMVEDAGKGREITPSLIETLGKQVRGAGTVAATAEGAEGLANTALFDLFGGATEVKSLALDKAAATTALRAELADEARRFGTLAQKRTVERAGQVAGQVLRPDENAVRAQAAQEALVAFDKAMDLPTAGETQGVLDELAQALATRKKKVLSRTELTAAAERIKAALTTDAPALSSRNAWEAATARATPTVGTPAAPAAGQIDMFGQAAPEPAAPTAPEPPAQAAIFAEAEPVAPEAAPVEESAMSKLARGVRPTPPPGWRPEIGGRTTGVATGGVDMDAWAREYAKLSVNQRQQYKFAKSGDWSGLSAEERPAVEAFLAFEDDWHAQLAAVPPRDVVGMVNEQPVFAVRPVAPEAPTAYPEPSPLITAGGPEAPTGPPPTLPPAGTPPGGGLPPEGPYVPQPGDASYQPLPGAMPEGPELRPPLRVGMSQPSPVLVYGVTAEQKRAVREWITKQEHFAPADLVAFAERQGVRPIVARRWGEEWANGIRAAEDIGLAANNRINYDYADVSKLTDALRSTGMFPFITWSVKTARRVAQWLLQDPRLFLAIDRLNNLSEDDIQEAGLSPSYARLARLGGLGDAIAEHILGRPDATVMAQPWAMFMPFTEVGRPSRTTEEAGLLEKALDVGGTFGASIGPLPQLAARLTGQTTELGGSVFRTTPYLEALNVAAGGEPVDIEAGLKQGIRGVRQVFGADDAPTITGSPIKDYYIRARIAEIEFERTGRQIAGKNLAAMDDPTSELWKRAEREVNRQMAGQTVSAAAIPFRTKALTETAEQVGQARLRQGISPRELATMTKDEKKAAWQRAERAEPVVSVFSSTGSDEKGVVNRQLAQWSQFKRQTQRMSPTKRAQMRRDFLDQRPQLQEYLAKHPLF